MNDVKKIFSKREILVPEIDVKTLTDSQVLSGSIQSPALFEELVRRYERAFIRKAVAVLRDGEAARDVVQETFVRIYISAKRFKEQDGATFSSWAYRILLNRCYTAYRKLQRRNEFSLEAEPEFAEVLADQGGIDDAERRVVADYVLSLISRLPALLAKVTRLHFIEGLSQKEIAAREGVSHGVVRQRLYRAKKQLKDIDGELAYATLERNSGSRA